MQKQKIQFFDEYLKYLWLQFCEASVLYYNRILILWNIWSVSSQNIFLSILVTLGTLIFIIQNLIWLNWRTRSSLICSYFYLRYRSKNQFPRYRFGLPRMTVYLSYSSKYLNFKILVIGLVWAEYLISVEDAPSAQHRVGRWIFLHAFCFRMM